MLPSSM